MRVLLFAFLLTATQVLSQMPFMGGSGEAEPVSITIGSIPDLDGTEINHYGANFNVARPIGKTIVGLGLGYRHTHFDFNLVNEELNLSTYENMHSVRANLFAMRPLGNSWSLMLSGGTALMSNFGNGISSEDFVINVLGGVTKRWGTPEKNSSLLLGVLYGTQFGEPRFLPAINFRKKINERWSYVIGLPSTSVNYRIDDGQLIMLSLRPEGFFGNNSNEVLLNTNEVRTNTKLQFNGFNAGLTYRLMLTKSLAVTTSGGYTLGAQLRVLDEDNNELYDLDPDGGFFFNLGLRYILKRTPPTPQE